MENAPATVRYVDLNSTSPAAPYTDWSSAATNIQDAIDSADTDDQILVTNGVYNSGARVVPEGSYSTSNRVAVTKKLTVQSVNGPAVTIIEGYQVPGTIYGTNAVRCVYLTNDASLIGFTLTNGATSKPTQGFYKASAAGGGVYSPLVPLGPGGVVSNCMVINNTAYEQGGGAYRVTLKNCVLDGNSANVGGGAAYCVLSNCTLRGNSALERGPILPSLKPNGGGSYSCQLNNCLVINNSAFIGGGAYGGSLNNCTVVSNVASGSGGGVAGAPRFFDEPISTGVSNSIIFFNTASNSPNYVTGMTNIKYSCTMPLPSGSGNLTNDPMFVNPATGDFHLQSNSPCINSGRNSYAPMGPDLDGNPRIAGRTVDMGAYEFQSPVSVLSVLWAEQYGLPVDGSADYADGDGDGMNNWEEWIAGTNPTNALSFLKISNATPNPTLTRATISWKSISGRIYLLQRAIELATPPAFETIQSNIVAQGTTTTYIDTNAVGVGPFFYRVGVQE